ncbi:MAG: STAS domain-containing protein [Anaerolineae bacterium]
MDITVREMKRVVLVGPVGKVNHETAPELQKVLDEEIANGHFKIVVDMSKVNYISSAGLRVLLKARKDVKRWNRGDLRLSGVQPLVLETLELVGFTRIFEMYDDTVDAVGSF